jgi:hypothetical protein
MYYLNIPDRYIQARDLHITCPETLGKENGKSKGEKKWK